jgi:predicted nucleotidyltransferase
MNLDQRTTTRILNIFKEFDKVEKVILFGSRAKGTAKVGSDIDLALVGKGISFKDLCRMGARLEDLDLPNKIDLVEYNSITNPELKFHIERVGIELQSLKFHENTVSESQHIQ